MSERIKEQEPDKWSVPIPVWQQSDCWHVAAAHCLRVTSGIRTDGYRPQSNVAEQYGATNRQTNASRFCHQSTHARTCKLRCNVRPPLQSMGQWKVSLACRATVALLARRCGALLACNILDLNAGPCATVVVCRALRCW